MESHSVFAAHLAMLKNPRRAKRDEDAAGRKQVIPTLRQRNVYAVETTLSVNVDRENNRLSSGAEFRDRS